MDPLSTLLNVAIKVGATVKAIIKGSSPQNKTITINSGNASQVINEIRNKGNLIILNVSIPSDSDKIDEMVDTIVEEASKVVDQHEGSIAFSDDIPAYLGAPGFTEQQRKYLKQAKILGWNDEKILSLRFAFKIANLEDAKKCKESLEVFEGMLRSRFANTLKKMYNFARSGTIDMFMAKAFFSPEDFSNDAMDKKLEYFPEAIFVNVFTDAYSLDSELVRRAKDMVRCVKIYARGKSNINAVRDCIKIYKDKHLETSPTLYLQTKEEMYELGCTPAVTITMELFGINEDLERIMAHREMLKKENKKFECSSRGFRAKY